MAWQKDLFRWMDGYAYHYRIGIILPVLSFEKQCRKLLKKLLGANARHDCLRLDLGPVVEQYVVQARQALLAQHCWYIHHRLVTITTTNTTSTTINKTKQNKLSYDEWLHWSYRRWCRIPGVFMSISCSWEILHVVSLSYVKRQCTLMHANASAWNSHCHWHSSQTSNLID